VFSFYTFALVSIPKFLLVAGSLAPLLLWTHRGCPHGSRPTHVRGPLPARISRTQQQRPDVRNLWARPPIGTIQPVKMNKARRLTLS
jgi:hypothetical protein